MEANQAAARQKRTVGGVANAAPGHTDGTAVAVMAPEDLCGHVEV